jgi:alpha-1,2-glucosyltransferase
MINQKKEQFVLTFLVFLTIVLATCLFRNAAFFVDEYSHFITIEDIAQLKITSETFNRNAQFPGYYLIVAALSLLLRISSLRGMRLISTCLSVPSVFVFYLIAKNIDHRQAFFKTLQFFFFPLLSVFFVLLYNDLFSLFLILLAFYFLIQNNYPVSGLVGLLSVLVRQNNIIWLGYFCAYIFWEKYRVKLTRQNLLNFFKDVWLFILIFLFLVGFILWNKGPAMAEPEMNPTAFHSENVFFILFLFFFLFLPSNINHLPKIIKLVKQKSYLLLGIIGVFVVYFFTFNLKNWYNNPTFDYFIHNVLANYAVENTQQKIIFFIPVSYSILSLAVTKFERRAYYLLYPFTVLFLSLLWMVEQRYDLIPFAFFMLFRKQKSALIEYATIALFIMLTVWIFWVTLRRTFFL